eukprot:Hpha_TRINITY_DN15947_c0_g4::TRINITY_DN15947_c0_g4_i1::g.74954::m.74954
MLPFFPAGGGTGNDLLLFFSRNEGTHFSGRLKCNRSHGGWRVEEGGGENSVGDDALDDTKGLAQVAVDDAVSHAAVVEGLAVARRAEDLALLQHGGHLRGGEANSPACVAPAPHREPGRSSGRRAALPAVPPRRALHVSRHQSIRLRQGGYKVVLHTLRVREEHQPRQNAVDFVLVVGERGTLAGLREAEGHVAWAEFNAADGAGASGSVDGVGDSSLHAGEAKLDTVRGVEERNHVPRLRVEAAGATALAAGTRREGTAVDGEAGTALAGHLAGRLSAVAEVVAAVAAAHGAVALFGDGLDAAVAHTHRLSTVPEAQRQHRLLRGAVSAVHTTAPAAVVAAVQNAEAAVAQAALLRSLVRLPLALAAEAEVLRGKKAHFSLFCWVLLVLLFCFSFACCLPIKYRN